MCSPPDLRKHKRCEKARNGDEACVVMRHFEGLGNHGVRYHGQDCSSSGESRARGLSFRGGCEPFRLFNGHSQRTRLLSTWRLSDAASMEGLPRYAGPDSFRLGLPVMRLPVARSLQFLDRAYLSPLLPLRRDEQFRHLSFGGYRTRELTVAARPVCMQPRRSDALKDISAACTRCLN
jgi:hypothetical protein